MELSFWGFQVAASLRRRWGVISTAAAFLLALAAIKGSYVDPEFPGIAYSIAFWLAIALAGTLVLAAIFEHFGYWFERDIVDKFRAARRDEIQDLIPFYERVVGTERPSLNELKELFNANNQVFRFLEKITKQGSKKKQSIIGFCTILPVTPEAELLLANEELHGLKMTKAHILAPNKAAKAIYIGSIGGDRAAAKAAVLNYVLGLIDDCASKGVKHVYTRPITKDGLRVAKKYGFAPVGRDVGPEDLKRLYVLDVTDRFERMPRRCRAKSSGGKRKSS